MVMEGRFLWNDVIDVGELRISRTTPNKAFGKARYVIYLPLSRNYLWKEFHQKRVRFRVFLEIASESEKESKIMKSLSLK